MSTIQNTRLRYISAKDVSIAIAAVNQLPYKVEVKGNPVFQGKRWFVFFVLPEIDGVELANVEL